jgi:hypothetical protein
METIPHEYYAPTKQQGTLVEFDYDTYESMSYEQKMRKIQKRAIVYLPYKNIFKGSYNLRCGVMTVVIVLLLEKHQHLWYLPPYSPNFNPIERTWANMKKKLRNIAPLHGLIETALYAYLT